MSDAGEQTSLSERAKALLRAGRAGDVVDLLTGAEGLEEDAEALETLAVAHFVLKDYAGSEGAFLGALRVEPRRTSSMINLGAVYNRMQQYSKAIDVLRKALTYEKKSAEAYYNLGYAHRNLKQFQLAIPAYREAIRLDPQMADAYQNLGNVYFEMANFPQAISHFTKALSVDPNHVRAIKGLEAAQSAAEVSKREIDSPFGTAGRRAVVEPPSRCGGRESIQPPPLRRGSVLRPAVRAQISRGCRTAGARVGDVVARGTGSRDESGQQGDRRTGPRSPGAARAEGVRERPRGGLDARAAVDPHSGRVGEARRQNAMKRPRDVTEAFDSSAFDSSAQAIRRQ